MTKAPYKRKHLTGGLPAAAEGEAMAILMASMVAGRHGAAAVAENLHVEIRGRQREGLAVKHKSLW